MKIGCDGTLIRLGGVVKKAGRTEGVGNRVGGKKMGENALKKSYLLPQRRGNKREPMPGRKSPAAAKSMVF